MKNLLLVIFFSFSIAFISCGEKDPIPVGRIEGINYPNNNNSPTDIYTKSDWQTFYKMKEISFLTADGILESKLAVVDSFNSPIPLSREQAVALSVSKDAKVEDTKYSTKEIFPSWRKNLYFEKEIIKRDGPQVFFEQEKGQTKMTFIQFLGEKFGLSVAMGFFSILSLFGFGLASFWFLKTKKDRIRLFTCFLISWIIFSFLFSFWTEAFNVEIVIATFIPIFLGVFITSIIILFKNKLKQIKRNRRKRQNKLKKFNTKPS